MARPDPQQTLDDAMKLKQERFRKRDDLLRQRAAERFNETRIDIPQAYDRVDHRHRSQIIEDEGRQIGTLVHAMPVPHVTPPRPEDQGMTTNQEQFLIAWHQEAEMRFGPVWWQDTLAQTHDNIGWLYCGWKRVPYQGQPNAPDEDASAEEHMMYAEKNARFKRDAGVRAYSEYRYVPTATAYPQGNVYDPDRFYEIKEVAERDLMATYGVTKNSDGSYSRRAQDATPMPAGYPENGPGGGSENRITVVEYWDREWCLIVARTSRLTWLGARQVHEAFVLDEWQHGWGRVPYFARPAFINDQLDEDKRYSGPLDGVYTEMPEHKKLRTMGHAVAYQTAFSPLQVLTREQGDTILDDTGNRLTFIELEPGKARQMAPGQQIAVVPQSPEIANLFQEIAASQARIERYSLSAVAKGVSPGADTANAALSNLHRFQLSTLDPMAEQASRQAASVYRFIFERIMDMQERVYVFDRMTDSYLSLSADEIVSVNVQAKVTPDQGQFQLLIEKHAAELKQLGLITLQEMYQMWGKENPEQYVLELKAEALADILAPVINNQIVSDLGMLDAINEMIKAQQQGGSARAAVPGIMQKLREMNPTGAGQGSGGLPRTEGVRSPVVSQTTQPQLSGGY